MKAGAGLIQEKYQRSRQQIIYISAVSIGNCTQVFKFYYNLLLHMRLIKGTRNNYTSHICYRLQVSIHIKYNAGHSTGEISKK